MTDISPDIPSPLIFASKVSGAPVFDTTGARIGHVDDVAIGKATGQVAYAVLAFGGFFGAGEKRYPLPWRMLSFDPGRNGYVVALDKAQLDHAPSYEMAELADVGESDERHKSWAEHWGPFI